MRALLFAVALTSSVALADKTKVLLDAPPLLRPVLQKQLARKYIVVPAKKPLSAEPMAAEVKKACAQSGTDGVLTAKLAGAVWSILVLDANDGGLVSSAKFRVPAPKKPVKALPKGVPERLEDGLSQLGRAAAPPPVEEPKRAAVTPPPADERPAPVERVERPKVTARDSAEPVDPVRDTPEVERVERTEVPDRQRPSDLPSPLRIAAGARTSGHELSYVDDKLVLEGTPVGTPMATQRIPFSPAVAFEVDTFPAGFTGKGVLARIGASLAADFMVGATAKEATSGAKYGLSSFRFRVGAVARIPIGRVELEPQVGLAAQTYSISVLTAGAPKPPIPDLGYIALRAGLGLRFNLSGPFSLLAQGYYRHPFATGEIGSATYFPHASAQGIDVLLGASVMLGKHFEIRASADYTRYGFSLNPEPGDPYVAGGALDHYWGGTFTLGWLL